MEVNDLFYFQIYQMVPLSSVVPSPGTRPETSSAPTAPPTTPSPPPPSTGTSTGRRPPCPSWCSTRSGRICRASSLLYWVSGIGLVSSSMAKKFLRMYEEKLYFHRNLHYSSPLLFGIYWKSQTFMCKSKSFLVRIILLPNVLISCFLLDNLNLASC